ncbi:MAG: hypothetical protein K9L84_02315 [Candidatus Omnitrophica bacterium]|nr:hypothetical protein [Candidatus Omnitrophota bacterium]MCF7893876.1 hypothetical protein [Candidatus Omnitrophota bacterium]
MENLERYLLEAAGKARDEISSENPYREIAFDGESPRLGWVEPVNFGKIKSLLESILPLVSEKENFIFIGMGGSINGIKPLLSVFKQTNFFTLDNLDPKAINDILSQINNPSKTLVVAISKSGTTPETQLLAQTVKSYFTDQLGLDKWSQNFLWLTDPESFEKLNRFGWSGVEKMPIQPNQCSDIGGRFSSPFTHIFILPLFLLLNQDFNKLEELYSQFINSKDKIRKSAYKTMLSLGRDYDFNFSPTLKGKWVKSFIPWIAQLFQESLGSKNLEKSVKTIVNFSGPGFINLEADFGFSQPVLSIMAQMYFYQLFIAYLSGRWDINFVSQEFVEKYKKKMRLLEEKNETMTDLAEGNLDGLIAQIGKKIKNRQRFIELVFYFVPDQEFSLSVQRGLERKFSQKIVLTFVGSDWNHQCYQAAFADKNTFYGLICLSSYDHTDFASRDKIDKNVKTLRHIALATYQTLSDKAVLYNFNR